MIDLWTEIYAAILDTSMERLEEKRNLPHVETGYIPLTSVGKLNVEHEKKIWYLGETVKKLYDLDGNPARKGFLDDYFSFMKRRGSSVTKVPVVAKLPLDLFRLFCVVQALGGFAQVVKKRRWSRVVRELDLPSSITSAAFTLRTQYMRLLYPYECEKKGIPASFLYDSESNQWSSNQANKYNSKNMEFQSDENKHLFPSIDHVQHIEKSRTFSSLSDDEMYSKSKFSSVIGLKGMQRPKSEELDRRDHLSEELHRRDHLSERGEHRRDHLSERGEQPDRPRSFENIQTAHESNHYKKYVNSNIYKPKFSIKPRENSMGREKHFIKSNGHLDHDAIERYYPYKRYERPSSDYNLHEKKLINRYETESYLHNNAHYELQGGTSSPGLPENARLHSYQNTLVNGDIGYHSDEIYQYPSTKQYESRDHSNERNGYFQKVNSSYRPPFRYNRLSTNPSEMKITIEERTETAMALSVIVNGISYTGTLLSTIPRL